MKKRVLRSQELTVRDEAVIIPDGSPRYVLDLDDDDVEKLAAGRVSVRLMERAYGMLRWKREAAQMWDQYDQPAGLPAKK